MGVGMNYPELKFSPIPVRAECRSKMAQPSLFFSRSLEIKSKRFHWILMRKAILIFFPVEEQEHFSLLSDEQLYRWRKLIFSTEKWILIQALAYQGGVINVLCQKGMSRSSCSSFYWFVGIYYRTTFRNNVLRIWSWISMKVEEYFYLLFLFLFSTWKELKISKVFAKIVLASLSSFCVSLFLETTITMKI